MLLPIFADVIAPVLVLIGVGVVAGLKLDLDRRALGRSVLYIFAPALAFDALSKSTLSSGELATIAAFVLIATGVLGLIVWIGARLTRATPSRTNALLLATLLSNTGNYGIALSLFAFGQEGMDRAVVFFVVTQALMYTLGVYLASWGQASAWQAVVNIARLPVSWAMLAAFIVRLAGWAVPAAIAKPAALAGQASVPILLVTLGLELGNFRGLRELPSVIAASAARLGLSVPVAMGVAALLGLSGMTRAVCVIQFAMPTAITPLALAIEFGADPELVTGVIFVTTIASIVTLTALLAFLR